MWGIEQVSPTVVEHGAPTGGRRRDAESEKTHGCFGEDGACHADGGLDHDRLNNVGQNVADHDAQIAGAKGASGFDKFAFAGGQDLSTDKSRVTDPTAKRERKHEIEDAGPAERDERDRQQNSWE